MKEQLEKLVGEKVVVFTKHTIINGTLERHEYFDCYHLAFENPNGESVYNAFYLHDVACIDENEITLK